MHDSYDAPARRIIDLRKPQPMPASFIEPALPPAALLRRLLSLREDGRPPADTTAAARFGPLLAADRVGDLTQEDLAEMLRHHDGTSPRRLATALRNGTTTYPALLAELAGLMDESRPILDRLQRVWPSAGPSPLAGISRSSATFLLHVAHPDKYAVWSGDAESAMHRLAIWPEASSGRKPQTYLAMNGVLLELARESGIGLAALESLWPDVRNLAWSSFGYGFVPFERTSRSEQFTVRLRKHQDSRGLVISAELLLAAGLSPYDDVELLRIDGGIVIAGVSDESRQAMQAYRRAREQYAQAFGDAG